MTLTRAHWLRSVLAGLAIAFAPSGASTLCAQGPDPFRPYNRQYDPYTLPMGPASAEAGEFVGGMPRSGNRGANQFQNYRDELQGAGRDGGDRGGIGMPYYRSSVDPSFDPKGNREYRPNREADRTYDESQGLVTKKYLAYFREKDPKKRAALLKDYNQTRGKVARALSTRRENQSRALETATASSPETRRSPAPPDDAPPRAPATERAPRKKVTEPARGGGTRAIPDAPPLFGGGISRGARTPRSPEDVLKRSRRLNPGDYVKPDAGAAVAPPSTRNARPASEFPPPE